MITTAGMLIVGALGLSLPLGIYIYGRRTASPTKPMPKGDRISIQRVTYRRSGKLDFWVWVTRPGLYRLDFPNPAGGPGTHLGTFRVRKGRIWSNVQMPVQAGQAEVRRQHWPEAERFLEAYLVVGA